MVILLQLCTDMNDWYTKTHLSFDTKYKSFGRHTRLLQDHKSLSKILAVCQFGICVFRVPPENCYKLVMSPYILLLTSYFLFGTFWGFIKTKVSMELWGRGVHGGPQPICKAPRMKIFCLLNFPNFAFLNTDHIWFRWQLCINSLAQLSVLFSPSPRAVGYVEPWYGKLQHDANVIAKVDQRSYFDAQKMSAISPSDMLTAGCFLRIFKKTDQQKELGPCLWEMEVHVNSAGAESRTLGTGKSISWLLMTWLLASPCHQQAWYWMCKIKRSMSSMRDYFNYLCHLSIVKWSKIHFSAWQGLQKKCI